MRPIIFDLDGTLVDSCRICVTILTGMLEERDSEHRIDPVAARKYMSRGGAQMIAALLGPSCTDPEAELADFRQRYKDTKTPIDTLFPGVADNIARLHDHGFTLAICSNKPQYLCEKVLQDTDLAQFFDVIVGSQPGFRPKPETDLLDEVLAQLKVAADECLYIGDSELDHQVALTRRMPFLFMTYGYADEDWEPVNCESFECFQTMTQSVIARHIVPAVRAARA